MTASLAFLLAVPLSGLARVDLWRGGHALLFREVDLVHGLSGVIIAIAACYVITFLSNVVAGRLFCGWGCPVGQVSRFGDAVDAASGRGRRREQLAGAAFSGLFVLSVFAWWVDLRVFWRADAATAAIAWGLLASGAAGAYLHGRVWRWEFCKRACPIGLYYSFVSPASWFGVNFRDEDRTCIDCDACDGVCPVALAPRDLMRPVPPRGGISIADAPGRNHCLECGDCVRACEFVLRKHDVRAPLALGYYRGPQRRDAEPVKPERRERAAA